MTIHSFEDARRQREAAVEHPPQPPLKHGDGDGTSGGMDAWQQSTEQRLNNLDGRLDSHLKWLLLAFAAGFIVLAGLVVNRTDSLSVNLGSKIEAVGAQVSTTNERIARLEGAAGKTP